MTLRSGSTWLPSALLLLQVPGCLSLSGPGHVTGTVGGSLSVQCRYEKEFKENNKYWCKSPCLASLRTKIVETTESEREVRRGRVSIRDHPATLTFTVTLESLTEGDGGTYRSLCLLPESPVNITFLLTVALAAHFLLEVLGFSLSCGRFPHWPLCLPIPHPEDHHKHPGTSKHPGSSKHLRTSKHPGISKHPGTFKHPGSSKHPGPSLLPASDHRAQHDQPGDS
ncbi:uncharacterized protein LOC118672438 isoform X2 [Myotis myotis]|uniref:uncharacterized protein LOC118672438 isoform X2 n=1 Tax=Myotis myotis TaxID=51298 RepID=UPI0017486535|nr:uncharacterized protein LOC118672438 isoform X2 [Myotis myotis]